jgi:hypothetical protein
MESVSDRSSSPVSEPGCDSGKLTVTLRFIISSKVRCVTIVLDYYPEIHAYLIARLHVIDAC